jgi:arginase
VGYAVVEVPAMAGDPGHPAAAGPAAITAALRQAGCEVRAHRVSIGPSTRNVIADSIGVSLRVKQAVSAVVAERDLPLVLAGSCDVAPAVLAGVGRPAAGVIWIDAHADFNTPESSVSGFWPGMTLAVVVGDCGEEVWGALGGRAIASERVVLIGVRSLSPEAERQRLHSSAITVVPWRDRLPQRDVTAVLVALAQQVDEVYIHLDLDALDPSVGRGIVDPPVGGGLSASQLADLLTAIVGLFEVVGASIATYTPANDDGRTLMVALEAIRRIVTSAG